MKKFNQLVKKKKKKILKIFLSSIKTKIAIKFLKELFFLPKIGLALKELIPPLLNDDCKQQVLPANCHDTQNLSLFFNPWVASTCAISAKKKKEKKKCEIILDNAVGKNHLRTPSSQNKKCMVKPFSNSASGNLLFDILWKMDGLSPYSLSSKHFLWAFYNQYYIKDRLTITEKVTEVQVTILWFFRACGKFTHIWLNKRLQVIYITKKINSNA